MKKLVRDLIPQIIMDSGKTATYYQANDAEFRELLKKKLIEEAHEFVESESMEELADVLEVIDAIYATYQFDIQEVAKVKREKTIARGAFQKKIVLVKNL